MKIRFNPLDQFNPRSYSYLGRGKGGNAYPGIGF